MPTDLSLDSAENANRRMMDDVRYGGTGRVQPPRAPPASIARGGDDEPDPPAASARVADESNCSSARISTDIAAPAERPRPPGVRDMYEIFEKQESRLFFDLAPHERARLRRATCPPQSPLGSLYSDPETTIVLAVVGTLAVAFTLSQMGRPGMQSMCSAPIAYYRSTTSPSTTKVIDSLSSWVTRPR